MQPNPPDLAVAERVKVALAEQDVSVAELARRLSGMTPEAWRAYLDYMRWQTYLARRMSGAVEFSATDLVAIAESIGVQPAQLLPAPVSA